MKTIRKDYPRVRQYVKSGNIYFQVDLRRKHYQGPNWKNFTDRQAALSFAADWADKIAQTGLKSIADAGDASKLKAWGEQAALYGKTLDEAMETALAVFAKEKTIKESRYMAELLSVWIDDKTTGLKKLRPRSLETLRDMANRFKADFEMARIKEIDSTRIESYLKGKNVTDQTRLNICRYLQQFFNWCIDKGHYSERNPVLSVKKQIQVERTTAKFFNIEQSTDLLKTASQGQHRALLPYIALGLFAGIRPEECERMTWDNIKMDTKEIFIQAAISKTKRDRIFGMTDNLFEWLEHCKDVKELTPKSNLQNMRVRLVKDAKVKWIADGLRHSFATYHYAKEKNLETLRHIMGNSPGVIEHFYKGAISHAAVVKFWSITPTRLNNPNQQ
jgi:integrase